MPLRLPSACCPPLLAVLLVVGGPMVAVEIVLAQLGRPALLIPWLVWAVWLGGQSWATSIVRLFLAGLVVVGLVLLVVGRLRPRVRIEKSS